MSNYGVFEASSTDGHEEEQRQRQATRDLGRAIEAAREGFGDFLGAATDKQDYKDRLALVMNDLMQKVADSGVMPVPGVMRKVKAALRPQFRKATRKVAGDLDDFESWVSEEANSVYDLASASRYLSTFPSGEEPFDNDPDALLYAYENQFAEASRKRAIKEDDYVIYNGNGEGEEVQVDQILDNGRVVIRFLDGNDTAQVDLSQLTASRKTAAPGFDPNISDDDLLGAIQIAEALNHDGSNQAKVDELRAEARSRGILSSRKQAGTTGGGEEVDLSNPSSLSDEDLIYWSSSAGGSYISDSESDAIHAEVKARGLEQHVRDVQNYKVDWTPPDKYNYFGNRKASGPESASAIAEFLIFCDKERVSSEDHDSLDLYNGDDEISQDDYNTIYDFISGDLDDHIYDKAHKVYRERTGSRRKVAVQWRFDDMGMPEFDWVSWWTVPEESAEASNGVQGLVVEDGTGRGGYNWSIQDIATSDDLQSGNAASVEQAKAEVEQAMSRYASRKTAAETFQPGDKVMKSGYPGTVQSEYMDGMYEVRMERGTVVVPAEELTRVSSRKQASADDLFPGWGEVLDEFDYFFEKQVGSPLGDSDMSMEEVRSILDDFFRANPDMTEEEQVETAELLGITASRKTAMVNVGDRVFFLNDRLVVETDQEGTVVEAPAVDPDTGFSHPELVMVEWDIDGYDIVSVDNITRSEGFFASRKVAVQWVMNDYGMGDLGYESWETVPEDSADAAVGTYGIVTIDGSGQGGYNWSVVDPNDSGEWIAHGNEATVDAAKAAAERAL